jgi:translation initiation factor IF-2
LATFRVYEVAEDLGVDSKQLLHMLHEMDVRVRSHMSSVTEDQIARLHARLERERRTGGHAPQDAPSASGPGAGGIGGV